MKCKHCYKQNNIGTNDLLLSDIESLLRTLHDNGYTPKIILSGGETLLYPQIDELLYALNGKYEIRLNTNGLLLKSKISCFKKIRNLKIQVSLDGYDNNTYKEIRNNDSFIELIDNVKQARNIGLDVFFRSTITRVTIDHYECFMELSREIGVPLVMRPIINTGLKEQQSLMIEYKRLLEWCDDIKEKKYYSWCGGRNLLSENACPLLNRLPVISILSVDCNGDIYPCSLLRGKKFYSGNISNITIEELDRNLEKVCIAAKEIISSESCRNCGFRSSIGDGTCIVSCYFGNKKCVHNKIYSEEL